MTPTGETGWDPGPGHVIGEGDTVNVNGERFLVMNTRRNRETRTVHIELEPV